MFVVVWQRAHSTFVSGGNVSTDRVDRYDDALPIALVVVELRHVARMEGEPGSPDRRVNGRRRWYLDDELAESEEHMVRQPNHVLAVKGHLGDQIGFSLPLTYDHSRLVQVLTGVYVRGERETDRLRLQMHVEVDRSRKLQALR
jgi:hypothetical protein